MLPSTVAFRSTSEHDGACAGLPALIPPPKLPAELLAITVFATVMAPPPDTLMPPPLHVEQFAWFPMISTASSVTLDSCRN